MVLLLVKETLCAMTQSVFVSNTNTPEINSRKRRPLFVMALLLLLLLSQRGRFSVLLSNNRSLARLAITFV
jgi:hypothetical protein